MAAKLLVGKSLRRHRCCHSSILPSALYKNTAMAAKVQEPYGSKVKTRPRSEGLEMIGGLVL